MKDEPANPLRAAVKQGLLGVLSVAEGSLAGWKEEKEEERVLDLIAEAELTRKAAMEARKRRSLPEGVDQAKDKVAEDLTSEEIDKWAQPEVLDRAFERKAIQEAKAAERASRKERNKAVGDELAQRAKSIAFSAAASVSEAVISVAEGEVDRLPGEGVAAEDRQPKPPSKVRQFGRAVAGAAKGLIAFAQQQRDEAERMAEADAQWTRLEKYQAEMSMLGLQRSMVPPSSAGKDRISERQLRKAFRKRSRELHPDLNRFNRRKEADIRDLNAAYEKLRTVL